MLNIKRKMVFLTAFVISFYFTSTTRFSINSTSEAFQINLKKLKIPNFFLEQKKYDDNLARKLYEEVKVLCMILTHPANHANKSMAVKNTWGKKCNKLIFLSSESHSEFDVVTLEGVNETRSELWNKTRLGFLHLYRKHLQEFDYFLKADDDKYEKIILSRKIKF